MLKATNHISKDNRNPIKLNKDLSLTLQQNPGLMIFYKKTVPLYVYGNYKLIDNKGIEQGNWDIKIPIPKKYPFEFPGLIEISEKIIRIDDNHISDNGVACTELDIISLYVAQKGITITDFINKYVLRYFSWQLLKENNQTEHLQSWAHSKMGLKEFFYQVLETTNDKFVLECLKMLLKRSMPGRNEDCFCGFKKKYKKCHANQINLLDSYGMNILGKYINIFEEHI